MINLGLALTGILVGIVSGLFGIGGGILAVPILMLLFHFSQHKAQGTSLAMLLPPVGILAVYRYWKEGYVEAVPALVLAATFFIGAYFGANLAVNLSPSVMQRSFGIFLVAVGGWMVVRTYL